MTETQSSGPALRHDFKLDDSTALTADSSLLIADPDDTPDSKPPGDLPIVCPTPNPPTVRDFPKVLCLGMSYASMEKQLSAYNVNLYEWLGGRSEVLVDDVLKCVKAGMLTEMDARDLARIVASEKVANVDIYTVSQEKAAQYDTQRHLFANFNRHSFVHQLYMAFATDSNGNVQAQNDDNARQRSFRKDYQIRYRQVILDYFWIPQGWDDNHWSRSFFTDTLVDLVKRRMLDMGDNDAQSDSVESGVYLPFCFHVFRQIINALGLLREYYAISFLRKEDLHEISLWKGTQTIGEYHMSKSLGKNLDQENIYCTFGYQEVMEAGTNARDEPKKVLMDILSRLENFVDIRMIKLRPLHQHHPIKVVPTEQHEKGGLKGLVDPALVKHGFMATAEKTKEFVRAKVSEAPSRRKHQKKERTPGLRTCTNPAALVGGKKKRLKRTAILTDRKSTGKRRKTTTPASATSNIYARPTVQRTLRFNRNGLGMATRSRAKANGSSSSPSMPLHDPEEEKTRRRSSRRNLSFVSLPMSPKKRRRRSSSSTTKGSPKNQRSECTESQLKNGSNVAKSNMPEAEPTGPAHICQSDETKSGKRNLRSSNVLEILEPPKECHTTPNLQEDRIPSLSAEVGAPTAENKSFPESKPVREENKISVDLSVGWFKSTGQRDIKLSSYDGQQRSIATRVTPSPPSISNKDCKDDQSTSARRALLMKNEGIDEKLDPSFDAGLSLDEETMMLSQQYLHNRDQCLDASIEGSDDTSISGGRTDPNVSSVLELLDGLPARDRLKCLRHNLDPSSRMLVHSPTAADDDVQCSERETSKTMKALSARTGTRKPKDRSKETQQQVRDVRETPSPLLTERSILQGEEIEEPTPAALNPSCRVEEDNVLAELPLMEGTVCL